MKKTTLKVGLFTLFFIGFLTNGLIAQTTLIDKEDSWVYIDDGSNQGTSWIDSGFVDTSWSTGPGIFGKDNITGATQTTVLNKHITTYFRKEFTLTNPTFTDLYFNLLCDDGAIIYLNGKEVFRDNMPTGTVSFTTTASSRINGADEGDYDLFSFPDTFLINGVNTIAVELHDERSVSIDDMAFDLELIAEDFSAFFLTKGESWNYKDDGSNLLNLWIDSGYNDASWSSGDAVLGYGSVDGSNISTTVSYGSDANNKHATTYFRKEISLTNPNYTSLQLSLLCDDGAAVYINGKLALSYNMPSTWSHSTYASAAIGGTDEGDYDIYTILDSFLVNGVNTIAVEVHQANASSSDLGFDLAIEGKYDRYVQGKIFLDMNGDGLDSSQYDIFGSGAIEIRAYNDADSNGVYTDAEIVNSILTSADGTYSMTVERSVRHLVVKLMTEDMDSRVDYTTDTVYTFTLNTNNGTSVEANFGQLGPRSLCLIIADDNSNTDEYYIANRITGKNQFVSEITGHTNIEGLAVNLGMDTMWAADGGQLGYVDFMTGAFTNIGTGFGYGYFYDPGRGGINLTDVDGMAYDPINDLLYGVHRRSGSNDLLFVINRSTGRYIEDYFGADHDFAPITGSRVMTDVDDIAFNPYSGQLLAINNLGNGDSSRYITIDPTDGSAEVLSYIGVGDFEGLGYYNTGELYGTTGTVNASGYHDNTIYQVDRNTGSGTRLDTMYSGGNDLEACDCLTGPLENLISGVVFYDEDSSGSYNGAIDSAYGGIKLYLYRDVDGDGIITSADNIIDSVISEPNTGFYVFITDSLGDFLVRPVIAGSPFDGMNTTTSQYMTEDASFIMHGDFDGGNDFGFHQTFGQPYLPVTWLAINAKWIDTDALVEWSTAAEVNTSHFELERRSLNKEFAPISTLESAGNSNETNHYAFVDHEAYNLNTSFVFYRVKQFDFDGKYEYSEIVSLRLYNQKNITAFPTLVNDYINVLINGTGEYNITLFDLNGNVILNKEGVKESETIPIKINNLDLLSRGLYLLQVNYANDHKIIKIIK